jgi:hypothetical protein
LNDINFEGEADNKVPSASLSIPKYVMNNFRLIQDKKIRIPRNKSGRISPKIATEI